MMQKQALAVPVAAAAKSKPQDIAYAVMHDLRAPIINIRGFSEALSCGVADILALAHTHENELPEGFSDQFCSLVQRDLAPCLSFLTDSVLQLENQVDHISTKFSLEQSRRDASRDR